MARMYAVPDVPPSERLARERRLRQRLDALEACGWERLAPLAQHMAQARLVRARGDTGAPVRHLGLEVLRQALCRLLSQDEDDADLIFRLVVEGADPAVVAAERGVSRLVLLEQLRDAVETLACAYEHTAYQGVVQTQEERFRAALACQRGQVSHSRTQGRHGMETEDWCGLIVRTRARLRFGVVVGMFTDGPYAGRLRVHGTYRFGSGTQAEWQGTLVYAIPLEALRRTRRGSLRLPVEAMAARAAWLVGELSRHEG